MSPSALDTIAEFDIDEYARSAPALIPALHSQGRMARSRRGLEILSTELNVELLKHPALDPPGGEHFENNGATAAIRAFVDDGIFLFMDRARHRRIRKVFARGFAAKHILTFQDTIEEITEAASQRLVDAGGGNLYIELGQRIAAEALCRFIGVPVEDIESFLQAALALHHIVEMPLDPYVPLLEGALNVLGPYAEHLVRSRRVRPTDDFVTSLVLAEGEEGGLTGNELIWGVANLLLGGIHTTGTQLSSTLYLIVENGLWDELAHDTELIDGAVGEAMRLLPVPAGLVRRTVEPIEIDGVALQAGQQLVLNLLAAGRDPSVFDNPECYDIRRNAPVHAFGGGTHRCIGERLAWAELTTAVRCLVGVATDVTFCAQPRHLPWTELGGYQDVDVSVTARE